MKALLIDVNFQTGKRPQAILNAKGGIKKDLWCGNKWQNLDTGKEIRIVKDGNVEIYEGQEGIHVLNNKEEIREALLTYCPAKEVYSISNESIMNASIFSLEINFLELDQAATEEEELAFVYSKGARGIDFKVIKPQDPDEISFL